MDISNLSNSNSGIHYLLLAVDIFTRKAFVDPLKNKTSCTVINAFDNIIKEVNPEIIQTDKGSEFISGIFKQLLKRNNVELQLINVGDHNKLAIINRFCRTIREILNKYMTSYKTTRYIDVLSKLIDNYNNTEHSTTTFSPNEAKEHVKEIQKLNIRRYNKAIQEEKQFSVGNKVRCVVNLSAFEKRSLPRWSSTIHTVVSRTPHSYTLDNGKSYKPYELQLISGVHEPVISTRTRTNKPTATREEIKRDNTIRRRIHKESIETQNIIDRARSRILSHKALEVISQLL